MVETELLISVCKPEAKSLQVQFAECTAQYVEYAGMRIERIKLEHDPAYRKLRAIALGFGEALKVMETFPKAGCEA